jgi:hypothetical protein
MAVAPVASQGTLPHIRTAILRGTSFLELSGPTAQTTAQRDWSRYGEEILRSFSAGGHLLSSLDVELEEIVHAAFGLDLPAWQR